MSLYKVIAPEYRCRSRLCLWWNHWLNPLGAWIEPRPTPAKRAEQAKASRLPASVWWWLRNPAQNLANHWLGIVPLGASYLSVVTYYFGSSAGSKQKTELFERMGKLSA